MHRDQPAQESLHDQGEEILPQNAPQVDGQEWWVWLLGEDETPTDDDTLHSRQSTWAEEVLDAEELMYRIHTILGDLPMLRRRAFVLNVLEAYELFEIAMLQDRPENEVRADIEAARKHLRELLRTGLQPHESADQRTTAPAKSAQ
jgi:DNA-directed RNA polymerase specialized sigma24 family protein